MNDIINYINQAGPIIEPTLNGIFTTVICILFTRRNAKIDAIEQMKADQLGKVTSSLIESGDMSYTELYKCKNCYKIAKLADDMMKDSESKNDFTRNYDPDWFIRFFDAVGLVSNEDMQRLWAKILKCEIEGPGKYSLRTLETVHNLTSKEASLFTEMTQYFLNEQNGIIFLMETLNNYSDVFNNAFGIKLESIMLLQDCGLLGNLLKDVRIDFQQEPWGIWNDQNILKIRIKDTDIIHYGYKYDAYPLTSVGTQLFPLVRRPSNNDYLIGIQTEIEHRFRNIETNLEEINWK